MSWNSEEDPSFESEKMIVRVSWWQPQNCVANVGTTGFILSLLPHAAGTAWDEEFTHVLSEGVCISGGNNVPQPEAWNCVFWKLTVVRIVDMR